MNTKTDIKFDTGRKDFVIALNKRVNSYFKTNQISRHANGEMVLKSIVMMALYFGPYALMVSGVITGVFTTLLMVVIMGLGLAGIGLCIMHDGNHGAYASKPWINTVIGYSLNMIGANSFNWRIQHNVLHHAYTNVNEHDEDISPKGVLRLNPHTRWKRFHKYQFIYAWFIYGLMTIAWMFFKDFNQLIKYQSAGLLKKHNTTALKEWSILIFTKVVYIGYIFIIPLLVTPWLWWQVIIGIMLMHYITGFILAIIFQPAHVVEGTEFPLPDDDHTLANNWAIHQLHTTSNYGNSSRWFSWLIGGLNFQIEHHLFPSVCHVHYRKISGIVKSTAHEYGLPYKTITSFTRALQSHMRLLKTLGTKPA